MVKFIAALSLVIFFGCEINGKQIIKPEKFKYDSIKFDVVSKQLVNNYSKNSTDHKKISEIVQYWFDNRVKSDGFEGSLSVNVKQIQFDREKSQDYYKFTISLSLEFLEQKSLTNIKTYNVNSNEYGEIKGSFAIQDQDNLDINLMHKALQSISLKLKELN